MTFAKKILDFYEKLDISFINLPVGVSAMNPYNSSSVTSRVAKEFYNKYYSDNESRKLILGINPGRLGAGATAIPFTDTKRLKSECGIDIEEFTTHEPSSVFVYDVIKGYGGTHKFYSDYYISSISPLGFLFKNEKGNEVNFNFYDDPKLMSALKPFIINSLNLQIEFGIKTDKVIIFGSGKNFKYFEKLNREFGFFREIISLEHPRYIMQYKLKDKMGYIKKYLDALTIG